MQSTRRSFAALLAAVILAVPCTSARAQTLQPGTRVRVHKRGRSGHTQSLLTVGTSGRLRLSVPMSDDARPRATRVSFRVEP